MSSRLNIPVGARMIETQSATIPTGADAQYAGCTIHVHRFEGMASDGYKSGYQARLCEWVEVIICTANDTRLKRMAWRFGGKNVGKAAKWVDDWMANFAELYPNGCATFPTAPMAVAA